MDPCAFNMSISALACSLSEGKSNNEILLLSAFFTQLGDCLETISAVKTCNNNSNQKYSN